MPAEGDKLPYVHHPDGYSNVSLFNQNILKTVTPHVTAAARSLNENREDASFVVVDYGAADGVNSVPIIAACVGEMSAKVSEFKWLFNDAADVDKKTGEVKEQLIRLLGRRKCTIKLQFIAGNFYHQVVPDGSVDLGFCASAVHWMSARAPNSSDIDFHHPTNTIKEISAKDWMDFLQSRAKELKEGGRLVITVFTSGHDSPNASTDKKSSITAPQQCITDMFTEGIITEEEYDFAKILQASSRTESDLQAPFLDPESGPACSLRLVDMRTYHIPCPIYHKWKKAGGQENFEATEEFVKDHVNFAKIFCNSHWKILEETRSSEDQPAIVDDFYQRVKEMVRGNLEGYHSAVSVTVVEIVKKQKN